MRNRIITALVILGVLLPMVYISPLMFKVMAIILLCFTTYEFLHLKKDKEYSLFSRIIIYLVNLLPLIFVVDFTKVNSAYIALILLLICSLILIDSKIDFKELAYLLTFSCFMVVASCSAVYLREVEHGFSLIIYVILVSAASDTGAFFVGNAIGKHKLIPRLSPNKSVEGLVGGIVLAIIVGLVYNIFLPTGLNETWLSIVVPAILGLTAAFGDLFFSSIKRAFNVKDFSNILPGHGGFLDRIDSHLMNFIVFFIIITLIRGW